MGVNRLNSKRLTLWFVKNIFSLLFILFLGFFNAALADLSQAINDFENGKYQEAADELYRLRRLGAIIPFKYLEYLKNHKLAKIPDDYANDRKFIPVDELKHSQNYLRSSLGNRYFKEKKEENAIKYIGDLLDKENHTRSFVLLPKHLLTKDILESKRESFKKFRKKDADNFTILADCFDFDTFKNFDFSLLTWEEGNQKGGLQHFLASKDSPLQLAQKVLVIGRLYKDNLQFWARLALENGNCEALIDLAETCLSRLGSFNMDKEILNNKLLNARVVYVGETTGDKIVLNHNTVSEQLLDTPNFQLFRYYVKKIPDNNNYPAIKVANLYLNYASFLKKTNKFSNKKNESQELLEEIFLHVKKAADAGAGHAQSWVADLLKEGVGCKINLEEAYKYYTKAADQGFLSGDFYRGIMLYSGQGCHKNLEECRRIAKKWADKEHLASCYRYASMLEMGEGGESNLPQALIYWQKLEKSSDPEVQNCCGLLFQNGRVFNRDLALYALCPQDLPKASNHYKRAMEGGSLNAHYNYGLLINNAQANSVEAFKYFKISADKGHRASQFACAIMLKNGDGIKEDSVEALRYLRKSANKGLEEAIILMDKWKQEQNSQPLKKVKEKNLNTISIQEDEEKEVEIALELQTEEKGSSEEDEELFVSSSLSSFSSTSSSVTQPALMTEITISTPSTTTPEAEEIPNLSKELAKYHEERVKEISEFQSKKYKKKAIKQYLVVKGKDYQDVGAQLTSSQTVREKRLIAVKHQSTIDFVESIFCKGEKKFTSFSYKNAKRAFADLGCMLKSVKGENSTQISFSFALENGRAMRLKYEKPQAVKENANEQDAEKLKLHNVHGRKEKNLYFAMQYPMKRFCTDIDAMPENLFVKK